MAQPLQPPQPPDNQRNVWRNHHNCHNKIKFHCALPANKLSYTTQ